MPRTSSTPNSATTTNPKIWTPSINIRVINAGASAAVTGATVFVKPADGCTTTYTSQASANTTTTTGGGVGALPEPGFPYGSYSVCAQRPSTGWPPTGTATSGRAGIYDAKSTSTVATETATNLVNDTIVNNTQTGTPTIREPDLPGHTDPAGDQRRDRRAAQPERRMSLRRRIRSSDERGFTLIEMLVAMSIGVVSARRVHAARPLVHHVASIADRQDGLQRGRQAMELMTRQLRSQVCVVVPPATAYSPPVTSATARRELLRQPERERHERREAHAHVLERGSGSITQNVINRTPNTVYPQMAFTGTGTPPRSSPTSSRPWAGP